MKRIFIILALAVLVIILTTLRTKIKDISESNGVQHGQKTAPAEGKQIDSTAIENSSVIKKDALILPIDQASERVSKKPFGIYITPRNSPVQPEKFAGYHTGTDFETFPDEQDVDIPFYAITSGKIVLEKWASGYGGVLVESGEINNNPVTIIYGHINLTSINKRTGDALDAGEQIGILGKGFSQETDGERKHLHLGIHRGAGVNIKGYVSNKSELDSWINPMTILKLNIKN